MKIKSWPIKSLFVLFLLSASFVINAQDLNEAKKMFNEGLNVMKEQPQKAVNNFEEVISICNELGGEAQTLQVKAENQLPVAYYNLGKNKYQNRDMDGAIEAFKKASELGEQYNNTTVTEKANNVLFQYYRNRGVKFYKKKSFEKALEEYKLAEKFKPDEPSIYYYKGLAYLKQKNNEKFEEAMKKANKTAEEQDDQQYINKTGNSLRNFYGREAQQELNNGNNEEAISLSKKALNYDEEFVSAYFFMAQAHNSLSQYDQAIEAAQKALELEEDDNEKKARFYYQLGIAYKGNGDTAKACEAYENAAYGDFAERAKYEREEVLNCP